MRLFGFILSLAFLAGTWANAQDIPAHSVPIGKGPGVAGFGVAGPCSTNQVLAWAGGTGVDPTCVNNGGGGGGTPGGANLNVQYNNGGSFGGLTDVQLTARIQPATAASSGALPAWPNNTTTFLRGDGTYATPSAAGTLIVGTSTITGGTTLGLLYDNAGVLGNLATANNSIFSTDGAGNPALAGVLPFIVTPATGGTGVGNSGTITVGGNFSTSAALAITAGATNQLGLWSSGTGFTGLATANSSILVTSAGGVPSLSGTLPFTLPVTTGGTGAATFSANLPLFGNGTSALISGTRSGNTTEVATFTGAATAGNCVSIDGNGNLIAAGGACTTGGGGGTVAPSTIGQVPVFTAATTVTGNAAMTYTTGVLTLGTANTTAGGLTIEGSTSGAVSQVVQGVAGTPLITWGNTSGTPAVTTSAPLAIATTTGNLSITGAAGTVLAGTPPAFSATPTLGVNGTTLGTLSLATNAGAGASVTLQNLGTTSAWNFNYPTTAGTANQLFTSQGGGVTSNTWQNIASLLTAGTGISLSGTTNATVTCSTMTSSVTGCAKVDGTSITSTGGVISSTAAAAGQTNYVCTGSGDATGINTALATSKTVHLVGAICQISSDLIFTTPGQIMYCEGRTITIIEAVASAAGFTNGLLFFNTGEPGPIIRDCGISFPLQVDTATRASLTNYPPAIFAQNTPRFKLERDRISIAMVGVDMRGNSGGSIIDDLEISCLSVCIWVDGAQDTVRLNNIHNWPFSLTANQQTLAFTINGACAPQTTSGTSGAIGLWSGRADDLKISNALWLVGTMNCFQPSWGNRSGTPWTDGNTFGTITGGGYDTFLGIVDNQVTMVWANTPTNSQTLSSSNILHFASYPGFAGGVCLAAGTVPFDITSPTAIQSNNVITACTATTATLTNNVAATVNSGDSIAGMNHGQATINVASVYFSGAANADAAIILLGSFGGGILNCTSCSFGNGNSGANAQVQQANGTLNISGGSVEHGSGDLPFYNGSGGFISINDMQIHVSSGITQTQSLIHVQTGAMEASIHNNHVNDHGSGTGTFLQVGADGFHNIMGNTAPGWTYTLPTCTSAICTGNN